MEDNTFLQQALKQSFYLPEFQIADNVVAATKPFAEGFFFTDKNCCRLASVFLSRAQIAKYTDLIKNDVERNPRLKEEYLLYKHDFEENIIIPKDYADARDFMIKHQLSEASRKAARKKKVLAAVFPADLYDNFSIITQEHREHTIKAEKIFNLHPEATCLSVLKDFSTLYKMTVKQNIFRHFIFWLNKKRFRYYLNEAAQILKSDCTLPDDFIQSHPFRGGRFALSCTFRLAQLTELLQKLAGNRQLLDFVQLLLDNPQKYAEELTEYKQQPQFAGLTIIHATRHTMQKLSAKYALLSYFNAVAKAFENDYLEVCPAAKHQPLPTVSPQNELQIIGKIISESFKTDSSDCRLNRFYCQVLQDYETLHKKFLLQLKKLLAITPKSAD